MIVRAILLLFLSVGGALAQQTPTPSQTALQIDNVINQWAQTLEAQQKQIEALQKENADLKAKSSDQEKK